nr:reverse transcriptase domain-containing protein [Tanacetum cinerariifolium]
MQNQLTNLTELITKFVNCNSASTSSSGTLPSNTITNPRSDLKAITTRSGVSYDGHQIPPLTSFLPKVVENEPEATKDVVQPTNNESTEDVQPQVVQSKSLILTYEPVNSPIFKPVAYPVSAPRPKLRPSIPYPSRLQDQKLRDKANDQREKFFQIFKDLNFNISFADALILMPKFGPSIKSLLTNKDKLYFDADPRVPLILGRSFLKTGRALIDVFEGKLTLRVGKEAITFNLDQTSRYSANYNDMTTKRTNVIDMACEEYSQEVLVFSNVISSGNPTPYYDPIVSTTSPTLTPFGNSDFLLEEVDAFLAIEDDPTSPEELKICEAKSDKYSINEPPEVELKDLPPHLEYAFLEGDDNLPVIIGKDLSAEEKTALITALKSHKRAIAWKLSDIKGIDHEFYTHKILMKEDFEPAVQHQRRVNPKIQCHQTREVDAFLALEDDPTSPKVDQSYLDLEVDILLLEAFLNDDPSLPPPNQEVDAFLVLEDDHTSPEVDQSYIDTEGDILLLEAFLNDDPSLPHPNQGNCLPEVRKELKICEAKSDKSSIDEPLEVELKNLPPHLEYAFLEGDDKFPVIIAKDLSVVEKTALITVLKSHKRAIAWKLFDIKGIDPEFCTHKILMEEDFKPAEKSHFMVKEGIVLGHKISKNVIEVDKAKVDVVAKLPHPTTVKGIRSFLGHAGFYQRFIQDFSKIVRPMTRLLEKDTPFHSSKECVEAFQTLKRKLTEAPILIAPD